MPFAPNYNNFIVMSYLNKSPSFINASIIIIVKVLAFIPLVMCSKDIRIDDQTQSSIMYA
jgi:hypothetical protein